MFGFVSAEWIMSTILIVDEDAAFRKFLHTIFDQSGGFHSYVEAGNGAAAIAKTKHLLFNLAVLDFSLPDMNGLQLARELKAIAPEMAIFMLTAGSELDFEQEALSCGITAVFSKLDDLTTLVANARAVCEFHDVAGKDASKQRLRRQKCTHHL
jgi:DNA-binding NarL/FixJ family response regulator